MLLSRDRILYVVNSGSQCITTYDLTKPELWEYAREFMKKDSTNLNSARTPSANMMGSGPHAGAQTSGRDTSGAINLNRDVVQSIPNSFART